MKWVKLKDLLLNLDTVKYISLKNNHTTVHFIDGNDMCIDVSLNDITRKIQQKHTIDSIV